MSAPHASLAVIVRFGTRQLARLAKPCLVLLPALPLLCCTPNLQACDLCAVYNANNASNEASTGVLLTVSDQFVRFGTTLNDGREVSVANPDHLNRLITHLVPAWNITPRFGVSLNIPVEWRSFQQTELRYAANGAPSIVTQRGSSTDLGDLSLIGRFALFQIQEMEASFSLNLLAGVRFPTGDTSRVRDEVEQAQIYESFLPAGTPHDPLGHSIASIHQHDLSPGWGAYSGVFGVTLTSRWQRWLFNGQFQYYLNTPGEAGFTLGDELILSGGPGYYVFLGDRYTVSLQANAVFDQMARDRILGRLSDRTGRSATYLGPQLALTVGKRFSANAGADLPLHFDNQGFQSVPDYIIHTGLNWRF